MKYVVLEEKYTENYRRRYDNAVKNNMEVACLVGKEIEYRIVGRNSILKELSDLDVVFEYCLYPKFVLGDCTIDRRMEKNLKELASSMDILSLYQVVKFIYTQDQFINDYDSLPFIVKTDEVIPVLMENIKKMSEEMKKFREGEFALYPRNIYEMIQGMIKNSPSFKKDIK